MFRYSMTLRAGNPQALMLPAECLHHYRVGAPPEAGEARGERGRGWGGLGPLDRLGRPGRLGRWLRAQVRRAKATR
ncbi:hypothetical protein HUS70_09585 [Pandoraea nosoerga]|uniref:hypothetical protein n=1 Tax=Pandoraea nosoerga TaxID=2508296 RepID=UPI001241BE5A|nr:hypothetical protein [Pandoraea nosoerga]MBN4666867.1 hypothetical protein [Pandoraea nosoerga]MBN4676999.1 hypothetical protein [Pandoraea nosoerga]MBN4681668.1 hypothetical protein [Pandoraea nosoerga]MBN4744894.1 hypothetical protein [Pandoraea nosoerga]